MLEVTVRGVVTDDAEAIQVIYRPIVESTHISFELVAPTVEEMRQRIAQVTATLPWLVATDERGVLGYAYAAAHSDRGAYRWAVDTSIYLADDARGRGIGTRLYGQLLDRLRTLGYVSAFAGIALPNPASVALHERVGFTQVGSFPIAGFKLGRWIDVSLWRCSVTETPISPDPPRTWRVADP